MKLPGGFVEKKRELSKEETSTQLNNINKFDVKSHQIDRWRNIDGGFASHTQIDTLVCTFISFHNINFFVYPSFKVLEVVYNKPIF